MKLHSITMKILVFILAIFGYMGQINAEDSKTTPTMRVIWQKEITTDANMENSFGQIAFNSTTERLLISGASFYPRNYSEGIIWLMEIEPNNGVIAEQLIIKDIEEDKAASVASSSLISGMVISENKITVVGKLANSYPLMVKIDKQSNISKSIGITEANDVKEKGILIRNAISLPDGNNLLIGRNGANKGLVIKVDTEGTRLWDKSYKIGQGRIVLFTDGLSVGNNGEFALVGCSANNASASPFPDAVGEDFIIFCNAKGDIVSENIFLGNPWPGEQPRMCQTDSGNFIIIYGKSMLTPSNINIRAYSPNLNLLWEKQVIESDKKKPSLFNIAATTQNGFVVAINVDFGNLRVYEYNGEGRQIANFTKDNEIGLGDMGLLCTNEKAFVAFQSRMNADKSNTIKIIALD